MQALKMFPRVLPIFLAAALACLAQPPNSSLSHLRNGVNFLKIRNFQSAALEFNQSLLADNDPAWTRVWSLINLGRIFDATGERDRAVKQYQLALGTNDDTFNALTFAKRYLFKPPPSDDLSPLPHKLDERKSPAVVSRVEPEYPAEALLGRLEGGVVVDVAVEFDASVTSLQVSTPLGLGLDEAALAAIRQWKFTPGTLRGNPIAMTTKVTVQFRLPSRIPGWRVTKMQCARTLLRADAFPPGKLSPEMEEEAKLDAAVSRLPTATLSLEINQQGIPENIQPAAASLPMWGEDAAATVSQWRFSPSQTASACTVDLSRVP